MIGWIGLALRRYGDFAGRSQRAEYWWFTGTLALVYVVLGVLLDTRSAAVGRVLALVLLVLWLATIVPSLAVAVRRLHDGGHSEWLMLLVVVPVLGALVLLVFLLLDGTPGVNRYGPDPKGRDEVRPQPPATGAAWPGGTVPTPPPGGTLQAPWTPPGPTAPDPGPSWPSQPPLPQQPQGEPPPQGWTGPPPSWGPPPGNQQ